MAVSRHHAVEDDPQAPGINLPAIIGLELQNFWGHIGRGATEGMEFPGMWALSEPGERPTGRSLAVKINEDDSSPPPPVLAKDAMSLDLQ